MGARKRTPLGITFGRVLKAARRDSGLSQEQLAALIDYSRVQIGYFEIGVSTPSLDALIRLENALELSSGTLTQRTVEALPKTKPAGRTAKA